jgi:hypothetical protein
MSNDTWVGTLDALMVQVVVYTVGADIPSLTVGRVVKMVSSLKMPNSQCYFEPHQIHSPWARGE